jgi:hypothetical protein
MPHPALRVNSPNLQKIELRRLHFADYSRDYHNLLGLAESRRHPIQKLNCAACETLGSWVALVLGVAQLPFGQVPVTFLTRIDGTKTAPETALPE